MLKMTARNCWVRYMQSRLSCMHSGGASAARRLLLLLPLFGASAVQFTGSQSCTAAEEGRQAIKGDRYGTGQRESGRLLYCTGADQACRQTRVQGRRRAAAPFQRAPHAARLRRLLARHAQLAREGERLRALLPTQPPRARTAHGVGRQREARLLLLVLLL